MMPLEEVGQKLIGLQVLSEAQWRLAAEGAVPLPKALKRLARLPGAWFDPDNPEARALTDYQRKAVLTSARRNVPRRMDRKLRLGHFLILRELGHGGMGVVLMGWDLSKRRYVAVKRVQGDSPEKRLRFRREARIISQLDHPTICKALGFSQVGNTAYLIMEYIPGRSLKAEVAARGSPVPWGEVVRWGADVLDGLAYAHGKGVIHRDVKPENIILSPANRGELRAKLLDMGLAKCRGDDIETNASADDLTVGGQLIGTPCYMAPEQWKGGVNVVSESDVYALGGTLFYALMGRPPFRAESAMQYCVAHTQHKAPRIRDERPDVPERLDELVNRMLAKHPRQRGTALELLWEFRQLLSVAQAQQAKDPTRSAASSVSRPNQHDKTMAVDRITPVRVQLPAGEGAARPSPAKTPSPSGAALAEAPEVEVIFRERAGGEDSVSLRFARAMKIKFHGRTIARLVPVPGQWLLYPVVDSDETLVWHNGEPVRDRVKLTSNDVVKLEDREWIVEKLLPTPAPKGAKPAPPAVEIWWDGKLLTRSELKPETRIGTAEGNEVRLPPATGYPPQWAVLAQTNRGWELHSLTTGRFAREGEDVGTDYLFIGADAVDQGGLRVVFRPPADPGASGKHDTVMQSSTPAPLETRDSPFYQRCESAYKKAASHLKKLRHGGSVEGVRSGTGLRRFFKWLSRPKDPAEELTRLEQELEAHPGDTATTVELARFFDRIGFDNLYGQVLIELFRTEPDNVQHLLELAEVYSRRARQADRPDSSRVQSAVEAYQCLIQAQKLKPDDNAIAERVKRAAAEMTILKGKFGG